MIEATNQERCSKAIDRHRWDLNNGKRKQEQIGGKRYCIEPLTVWDNICHAVELLSRIGEEELQFLIIVTFLWNKVFTTGE